MVGGLALLAVLVGALLYLNAGSRVPDPGALGGTPEGPSTPVGAGRSTRGLRDVGGLTADSKAGMAAWPRVKLSPGENTNWWPHPGRGVAVDDKGFLVTRFGDLPAVQPPRERLGSPYFMRPLWLEGSTAANDYYVRKCRSRVRMSGRLAYEGPQCVTGAGCEAGAWKWHYRSRETDGSGGPKSLGVMPQPLANLGAAMGARSASEEASVEARVQEGAVLDVRDMIQEGIELPPWYRRGKFADAALKAMKAACP